VPLREPEADTETKGRPQIKTYRSWDGIEIAYRVWGKDTGTPPVLLQHGFVADAESNWVATGVVDALVASGRWVLAPDARGHGASQKPHDPDRYGEQRMARDLGILLELSGAPEVDLVGYSMGAVVCLLLASSSEQVRRLVIGGVGSGVVECGGVDRRTVSKGAVIAALEAEDPAQITEPGAAIFRRLADALGGDRKALAAQARAVYRGEIALAEISAPTLLLAGEADPLAVRPQVLVDALPDARLELLRGNHLEALADPRFIGQILDFLAL
jgi:pimeloyl-ACP methyl ester carboxylesterase